MKNSTIHNGLGKKEIRDFLAMSLVKLVIEEMNNKQQTPTVSKSANAFDWAIKSAENVISYTQKQLEILRSRRAVLDVLKQNGWEEFDVSDETEMDLPGEGKQWMAFIGTKLEYDNLLIQIKKEKQ